MSLGDQYSEFFDWYEVSGQNQIDQALFDKWWKRVYENEEQLGIDFDQSYQEQVNAAADRLNTLHEYKAAQTQKEDETYYAMQTTELNFALAEAKPDLANQNKIADSTPAEADNHVLYNAQIQNEAIAQSEMLNYDLNLTLADAKSEIPNSDLVQTFLDKWQYNTQIILGTDSAIVDSEIWEGEESHFYLAPDELGINRIFNAQDRMIPEDESKHLILQNAIENGFMQAVEEFKELGDILFKDNTEYQKALLRAKTQSFARGMLTLGPLVGAGGSFSLAKSASIVPKVMEDISIQSKNIIQRLNKAEELAQFAKLNEVKQLPVNFDKILEFSGGNMDLAKRLLLSTKEALPGKTIPELVETFKLTETPAVGSLSGYQTRIWYKWQESLIGSKLDYSKPLEEVARDAFNMRNSLRTTAREAMTDTEWSKYLMSQERNKPFEQLVEENMGKGLSGDALWNKIIESSMKSRDYVDKLFDL